MRLLALILNILIGTSLSIYATTTLAVTTDNRVSRFEFQRELLQRSRGSVKTTASKLRRSHGFGNIWDRIRSGMQIPRPNPPVTALLGSLILTKTNDLLSNPNYANSTIKTLKNALPVPENTGLRLNRFNSKTNPIEFKRVNTLIEMATKSTLPVTGLMVADNSNNTALITATTDRLLTTPPALTLEQQEAIKKQQAEKQLLEKRRLERETFIYQRVNKHIIKYTQNKAYLYEVVERAKPYLYHIVNGLNQHQLPFELALLPIVESAYQPTAQSPKSAAGLWQFIPSTGLDFNLKQTEYYDDRLDITASTQAALRYLSFLKRHFKGDWLLALAAYNCGLGLVDEAIKKNIAAGLSTDYWSLNLPEETQDYVPRLLALSSIFAEPARYDLKLTPIRNEPYFIQIRIERELEVKYLARKNFSEIAELAGLDYEQFNRLNPGYLHAGLASAVAPATFLMPAANANLLQQHLDTVSKFVDADKLTPINAPSKSRAAKLTLYATITPTEPAKLAKLTSPFISLNINANKIPPG